MKNQHFIKFALFVHFFVLLLVLSLRSYGQATCASAIPIVTDGVCRTYNFTNTTLPSEINCTTGNGNPFAPLYSGQGRIIYFRFIYTGQCIRILSSNSAGVSMEAVLLESCSQPFGPYRETICFNDGYGDWATNHYPGPYSYTYIVGNTYILRYRLRSGFNGSLTICASTPSVTNNECNTAVPITTTPTYYNNSCNLPTSSIPPGGVCALSLENTATYTYTTQGNSNDILNISSINCDNYESNDGDWGYQVGIYTGTCGNLTQFGPCFQQSGGSLQWPLSSLPAGTKITILVDGISGSNCLYFIWVGTNPPPLNLDSNRVIPPRSVKKDYIVNPTRGLLEINLVSNINRAVAFKIFSGAGSLLMRGQFQLYRGSNRNIVNISHLPSGIYLILIIFDDIIITEKIIKI